MTARRDRRRLTRLLVVPLLALALALPARAAEITAERQAAILTRALAYDQNLKKRAGANVAVLVVYKAGNPESEQRAAAIEKAFHALESARVQGLALHALREAFTTAAALKQLIATEGVDAIYVASGLEHDGAAIRDTARTAHVLTMGATVTQVQEGLTMGVFDEAGKTTLVVNLPAATEIGATFGSDLLRLARVIR